MRAMYKNTMLNTVILSASTIALIALFLLIRQQTAVTDVQFLKSMIPHHAGAVLMCEKAPITDTEIKDLCKTILSSQNSEIAQMKTILARIER
jgi:uncharacterized protein (DUF305 family)